MKKAEAAGSGFLTPRTPPGYPGRHQSYGICTEQGWGVLVPEAESSTATQCYLWWKKVRCVVNREKKFVSFRRKL